MSLDAVRIGRTIVRLPTHSLTSSCASPSSRCYGFVVVAQDGRTAERVSWWEPARERRNEYSLNPPAFRVHESSVVVDGGISVPLSDRLSVHGCEVNTRQTLVNARSGMTLYLDGTTGTVVSAGCVGID
jgi:hypothetical protein